MLKKIILKIRYPRILGLGLSIVVGYLIYKDNNNFHFHSLLDALGYSGTFLAGAFFPYGFTTAPAVAILLWNSSHQNFWLAGFMAMSGSLFSNILIFKFMKISIENELEELSQNKFFQWISRYFTNRVPRVAQVYVFPALAGFISASPLPDEFAVALLSRAKNLSYPIFSFFSFTFSAFGILILLLIGRLI